MQNNPFYEKYLIYIYTQMIFEFGCRKTSRISQTFVKLWQHLHPIMILNRQDYGRWAMTDAYFYLNIIKKYSMSETAVIYHTITNASDRFFA